MNTLADMIPRISNWGRWGAEDELGTLNFITPQRRVAAVRCVRSGKSFSLALPLDTSGPWPAGDIRSNPIHTMLATGSDVVSGAQQDNGLVQGYADDMVCIALQAGTQWDSLAHIFHDGKMYNDRPAWLVDATGAKKNSITAARAALMTRGVLLDIPRLHGVEWLDPGYAVTPNDVQTALKRQGVDVQSGDILLFYTGHMKHVRSSGGWAGYTSPPEPGPGLSLLPWLHEQEIAAIACDTWALEAVPSGVEGCGLPIHQIGLVYMGLLLGEMFYLEELVEDCAADGQYDFLFCAPPLTITGAVGSPINPLAVK